MGCKKKKERNERRKKKKFFFLHFSSFPVTFRNSRPVPQSLSTLSISSLRDGGRERRPRRRRDRATTRDSRSSSSSGSDRCEPRRSSVGAFVGARRHQPIVVDLSLSWRRAAARAARASRSRPDKEPEAQAPPEAVPPRKEADDAGERREKIAGKKS